MADYEHSENFHKVSAKIRDINNLKDIENLKKKLGELEQDSEVKELLVKCEERRKELIVFIKEEKYQKVVAEFEKKDSDIVSLIPAFKELGEYKESSKYLEACEKEKKYRELVKAFDSGARVYDYLARDFEQLGDYKESKKYQELCLERKAKETDERYLAAVSVFEKGDYASAIKQFKLLKDYKESETYIAKCQELEKAKSNDPIYDNAKKSFEDEHYEEALRIFSSIEDWKDSKQWIEKCQEILKEKKAKERKTRNKVLLIIAIILFALFLGFFIKGLATWESDETSHWHPIFGSTSGIQPHTLDAGKITKETTCTNNGVIRYKCTVCGRVFEESIPAFGHSMDEGVIKIEPTCTVSGTKIYNCTVCGSVIEESIPALGHSPDEGVITAESTCTISGTKTYSCTICGAIVKTESIEKIPHIFVDSIIVQPKCETRGLAESTCSVCGLTTTRTLEATGHDWSSVSKTNPGCTQDGEESFVCKTCGKSKVEVLSATGHSWFHNKFVAPTCVSDGYNVFLCSSCGEIKREKVEAKGHHYLDGFCLDCGFDRNQYHVGDIGPAGGFIFYDCDEDNDSGNQDGLKSSSCGWRFLEVALADVRVIDGIPSVNQYSTGYSNANQTYVFGYYQKSPDTSNLYVNGSTSFYPGNCTGTGIGTGKNNTEMIVKAMGDEAYYKSSFGFKTTRFYAAKLCSDLEYTSDGKVFDDWFLPSKDELNLIYLMYKDEGIGGFVGDPYWSSSEFYNDTDRAWLQDFYNGSPMTGIYDWGRNSGGRVRPVRGF